MAVRSATLLALGFSVHDVPQAQVVLDNGELVA